MPEPLALEARDLLERASARRARSPEHTVVGFFGATGSGKSSLVNALVGADVARTHVRRPTTSEALAVTWDADGAVDLLDWLQVRDRNVRQEILDPRARQLVLLDLPDFDSVEAANREIAERLAAQVDALVWVVDPQKYADNVMHSEFIAPHARHAAVTLVVLNQVDLLPARDVPGVVASLRQLLEDDGLAKARVLPVSARTGDGIAALRTAIGDLAAAKAAREARLAADVSTIAARLPEAGTARKPSPSQIAALADDIAVAAGVDVVARAVGGSYRKRAAQATGWPLVSWISRFRADPLTRLGLGRSRTPKGSNPDLHRTSLPAPNAASGARASLAVRTFTDAAATGLTETWRTGIRTAANDTLDALPAELDLAIARTVLPSGRSWWWALFTIIQWIAIVAALVGVGWLLAAALLPRIGMPAPEIPLVQGWAVPTLLIAAGVALGILLGLLGSLLGAITGAARRRTARRRLVASVAEVTSRVVVAPLTVQLDRARAYAEALKRLA
jgi:GTP-binding protein EngB required for normal cell division